MRIAIAGTHGSGKTTLLEDFVARHPEYVHEPEPYEWLVELHGESLREEPGADDFYRQLELSVERLSSYPRGAHVIAERSPLDFIAYIRALAQLRRDGQCDEMLDAACDLTVKGMANVDLLVFLPLDETVPIILPESEDLELREAMNECLAEIINSGELHGDARVLELRGPHPVRLAALESAISVGYTRLR